LDNGKVYAPRAKSEARLLRIASNAASTAQDAKKVSLKARKESKEAKAEAQQAREESKVTALAQTHFILKYDRRVSVMEQALMIGEDEDDATSPCAGAGGNWTPPCTTPPRRRKNEDEMVMGCQQRGMATWNPGLPGSDK